MSRERSFRKIQRSVSFESNVYRFEFRLLMLFGSDCFSSGLPRKLHSARWITRIPCHLFELRVRLWADLRCLATCIRVQAIGPDEQRNWGNMGLYHACHKLTLFLFAMLAGDARCISTPCVTFEWEYGDWNPVCGLARFHA